MQQPTMPQRMPTPNDLFEIYKLEDGVYQLSSGRTINKTTINESQYQALQRLSKDCSITPNDYPFDIYCMTLLGLPIFEIGRVYKKEYLDAFEQIVSAQPVIINKDIIGSSFVLYEHHGLALYSLMLHQILWDKNQLYKCVFSKFEHPYTNHL